MFDYIIWDMDGTILNTLDDIADSVNFVLKNNGMKSRTVDEIRSFVGNGIPKLIERAVAEGTDEITTKKCLDEMLDYYKDHSKIKTAPYDGIVELMKKFSGKKIGMAVVTNKTESAAVKLCDELFGGYVDIVVGARDTIKFKPAPDGVFEAMKLLGCEDKNRCVYIGDSEVDVQTAHNSGLECIGVLWGFRSKQVLESHNCDYIVENTDELCDLILSK